MISCLACTRHDATMNILVVVLEERTTNVNKVNDWIVFDCAMYSVDLARKRAKHVCDCSCYDLIQWQMKKEENEKWYFSKDFVCNS